MDGFIILDKPKGVTSFSACNKLRRQLNLDKTGHNGTLDPNAKGFMIIGCNPALKLIKLIKEHDKEYIAKIKFGKTSKTLDYDSDVLDGKLSDFNKDELLDKINILKNQTEQIPPMTSAIKINGKKLYEYQRQGIEVELEKRPIKIYDIELLSYDEINKECDIRLFVSKGFYVRSFARDLGELLESDAIIKELRRTKIDNITIDKSKKLDDISEADIIKIDKFFDFPKVEVNDYIAKLVKNGVTLDDRQTTIDGVFFVTNKCDIIAVYEKIEDNKYKPILIL